MWLRALLVCCLLLSGCRSDLASLEYLERGILLAQREHYQEAIKNFNHSLELDPGNPDVFYERAVVYAQINKEALALEDYDVAIKLAPEFLIAYNNRGLLLASLGRHPEAIADFTTIIQLEPGNVGALESRSRSYVALQETEKAIADLTFAIQLESKATGYPLDLGEGDSAVEIEAGQDEAFPGSSYNALLFSLRGKQLLAMQKFEEALSDFDAAIDQDPELATAWLGSAIALAKLGEFDDARLDLNEAAQIDLGIVSDNIVNALQEISALEARAQATKEVSTSPQELEHDMEKLEQVLVENGWHITAGTPSLAVHQIGNDDSTETRQLYVAFADHNERVVLSGETYINMLEHSGPMSLITFSQSANGTGSYEFTENWKPNNHALREVEVSFRAREEDPAKPSGLHTPETRLANDD